MTHQEVSIFVPRTVCWQGNDENPTSQFMKSKHVHDSANGVCKAHVHTIPAKETTSAPPTRIWTLRELGTRSVRDRSDG